LNCKKLFAASITFTTVSLINKGIKNYLKKCYTESYTSLIEVAPIFPVLPPRPLPVTTQKVDTNNHNTCQNFTIGSEEAAASVTG